MACSSCGWMRRGRCQRRARTPRQPPAGPRPVPDADGTAPRVRSGTSAAMKCSAKNISLLFPPRAGRPWHRPDAVSGADGPAGPNLA
ncbi:hypothetical protein AvCA_02440 [Azotobacter vinelandii CA]|uniref:Uncharacterized protein n=2 Tax=Azotobacter vinelandii TaxID=354 RepID=C1DH98_AZOVD|nr:hypothetical protein Avin_02440 [Azotobacter vinelandii DJ]AGK17371.1 hypothetical protein AvCA_02440 [Azotobacter vinelandii CA]AGK19176.1 hypothetical protein AvCA6_02440 [Azotobacter vinelandii CA6]